MDHLVVSVHWGEARFEVPNPEEEEIAKKWLAAGASLVCGSGPHVLQKIAVYDNGVVAHSLGNFIFDRIENSQWNDMSSKSCILEVDFSKHAIEGVRVYPIITNSGIINTPETDVLEGFRRDFEKLYLLTRSDFYDSYGLWERVSARLSLAWQDARRHPVKAFQRHLKFRYFSQIIFVFWQKFKAILIIGSAIIACSILFIVLRRRNVGQRL